MQQKENIINFAFIFPGQGAQYAGSLNSLLSRREVKDTLQESSDVLGQDIGKIIAEGSHESFLTVTSPAIITASIARYRVWEAVSELRPSIVAGQSIGEFSALVAARVISFEDALKATHYRSALLQEISGSMASVVGLDKFKVTELCDTVRKETGKIVEVVAFNTPRRLLVSGDTKAVELVIAAANSAGAKLTRMLKITSPCHSSLVQPVSKKLHEYFKQIQFHTPSIPIINNVDVATLNDPMDIKDAMIRQVSNPVRWHEIIETLIVQGINQIVNCGPGNALNEMTTQINSNICSMSFSDEPTLFETIQKLKSN